MTDQLPPWALQAQHITPLMKEYDTAIDELSKGNRAAQKRNEALQQQLASVTDENNALHRELRRQAELLAQHNTGDTPRVDTEALKLLQEENALLGSQLRQYDMDAKAKDQMLRATQQEISSFAAELASRLSQLNEARRIIDNQAEEIGRLKALCETLDTDAKTLQKFIAEKDASDGLAARRQGEYESEMAQYQSLLNEMRDKQLNTKSALDQALANSKQLADTVSELEMEGVKLRANNKALRENNEDLLHQVQSLSNMADDVQKAASGMSAREMDAYAKVREGVELLEAANLARNQAELRLAQATEEIRLLEHKISESLQNKESQNRDEIALVTKQFEGKISALLEEIQRRDAQYMECTIKIDRAARDKKNLEAELEKVRHAPLMESDHTRSSAEHMQAQLQAANTTIHQLRMRGELLENQNRNTQADYEKHLANKETEIAESSRRISALQKQLDTLQSSTQKIIDEIKELRSAAYNSDLLRANETAKNLVEMESLRRHHELEIRALRAQLEEAENIRRENEIKLHQHITSKDRQTIHIKEESRVHSNKQERYSADQRRELIEAKREINVLHQKLSNATRERENAESTARGAFVRISELQDYIEEIEGKLSQATSQVNVLMQREKSLAEDILDAQTQKAKADVLLSRKTREYDGLKEHVHDIEREKSDLEASMHLQINRGATPSSTNTRRQASLVASFGKHLRATSSIPSSIKDADNRDPVDD